MDYDRRKYLVERISNIRDDYSPKIPKHRFKDFQDAYASILDKVMLSKNMINSLDVKNFIFKCESYKKDQQNG